MTSEATIETLWRAAFEQCELVFLGVHGYRLRYWRRQRLMVDEEVFDRLAARKRGAELKADWPRVVERADQSKRRTFQS